MAKEQIRKQKTMFADNIKYIRHSIKCTQEEMASILKCERVTYNAWESGINNPNFEKIIEISCIIPFTMQELMKDNLRATFTEIEILYKYVKPVKVSK